MELGKRIQSLRKQAKLTQTELAELINISLTQMVRYETKGVQPPADVVKRLADSLKTTTDFLINGTTQEKAADYLNNTTLLQQFKSVEQMNEEDKHIIVKLIDAFITKKQIQQLAS